MTVSNQATVEIRFAKAGDEEILFGLLIELARFEKLENELKTTPEILKSSLFGDKPQAEALLMFAGSCAIGYAIFFHNFSSFLGRAGLHLEDLFILPEYRGSGHGKVLLKRVAEIAKDRQCPRLEWWVLDWNSTAREFYHRIGAAQVPDFLVYRMTEEKISAFVKKK